MMTETRETPEVWVGCLGCYNAGYLNGEWVDATEAEGVTVNHLHGADDPEKRAEILKADPYAAGHEELWCFDHQGFNGFLSGECSPMEAQRIAESIAAIPDYIETAAVAGWLDYTGNTLADFDLESFEDDYAGQWDSREDYAQSYAEDIGAIPDEAPWPACYIDWERAAAELFMDLHDAEAPGGGIYVYRVS